MATCASWALSSTTSTGPPEKSEDVQAAAKNPARAATGRNWKWRRFTRPLCVKYRLHRMDTLPTTGGLNAFYITILVAVVLITLVAWYIVWKGRPLPGQHVF